MIDSILNAIAFIFSTPDPSVFQADPISVATLIVTTAVSSYSVNRQMHAERQQERATNDVKADNQRREDQLTNEAKAKTAAAEKMKSAGQRAGIGYGFGNSSASFFSSLRSTNPSRPSEDNIGRGNLFGN